MKVFSRFKSSARPGAEDIGSIFGFKVTFKLTFAQSFDPLTLIHFGIGSFGMDKDI